VTFIEVAKAVAKIVLSLKLICQIKLSLDKFFIHREILSSFMTSVTDSEDKITTNCSSHSVEFASKSSPDPVPLDQNIDSHGWAHCGHPASTNSI